MNLNIYRGSSSYDRNTPKVVYLTLGVFYFGILIIQNPNSHIHFDYDNL